MNMLIKTNPQIRCFSKTSFLTLLLLSLCYNLISGPQYQIYSPSDSLEGATKSVISLTVPPSGEVRLILTRSDEEADVINLTLSSFVDQYGNQVGVKMKISEDPKSVSGTRLDSVSFDSGILPLVFEVPDLPTPGGFTGYLFLGSNRAILRTFTISMSRPKVVLPATIIPDQQTITVTFDRPFLPNKKSNPEFTVHLYENSRQWRFDGLFVRLVEGDAMNEAYNPKQILSFEVNGDSIKDFWSLPAADKDEAVKRTVEPGEQASVKGTLHGLKPGEYSTKLQFMARNSQESDRQQVSVKVKIRSSIWWVIIVLTSAIVFSFFTSKWLTTRRQRLQFRRRLMEQRPTWLRDEPSNLSTIWTKAMFKQLEDLSQRWFLSGIDVFETRLNQIVTILKPLQRIREIRNKIDGIEVAYFVKRRAKKLLRSIINRLGVGPIDDNFTREIGDSLSELEAWFEPNKILECYGANLDNDVSMLLNSVQPNEVTAQHAKAFTKLVKELENSQKGTVEHERKYAALKILWERRNEDEFSDLVDLYTTSGSVDSLFKEVDKSAWERLSTPTDNEKFEFISPRETNEIREAYQPLLFEISTVNRTISNNYLFKHGLRYKWSFQVRPTTSIWKFWKSSEDFKWAAISTEPFVVQYVPRPGILTVSVKLINGDKFIEVTNKEEYRIARSSDFNWQRAFHAVEISAVGAAWLVALASGLLMFYLNNLTFGSAKDYLTLLLWGAGADQTKNFLQNLQIFSGSPPATTVSNP